jgi:hypothetical protein
MPTNPPTSEAGKPTPDPGSRKRALKVALAVSGSFTALVLTVMVLLVQRVITFQMALLMLVALLGLYIGLGLLYAVYRFVDTLE